jgi:choline dehydrogenase-like flavoprotein
MPAADNRIELDRRHADAHGVPRLKLHWAKRDSERKTALASAQLFGEALIQRNLGRLRLRDWLLDGSWPATEEYGAFHHMGGTRMSASPETGIVDRDCKVHGVANLHVGGSSVFATGGHANPTFTIVQLALRLGDHLASSAARA